jgi:gas vesicle protein
MKKFISFFIGAVVGGLVGASLSLLLAPQSGEEFRNSIKNRTDAFTSEIRQAVNTKRIELQGRLDSLRSPK